MYVEDNATSDLATLVDPLDIDDQITGIPWQF